MSSTPSFYYTFSEKYDYRTYLEEQSHFDRVTFRLDQQTAAILTGSDVVSHALRNGATTVDEALVRLQLGMEERLEGIRDTLDQGFHNVTVELGQVRREIAAVGAICTAGFDMLEQNLEITNTLLTQLLKVTENPDQTWANEKFRAAQVQAQKGNFEEAREFAFAAINGDDHNSGFKVEPAYHFFLGILHSGASGARGPFIDLEIAKNYFLAAARYFSNDDSAMRCDSNVRAAWCAYALGNSEEAMSILKCEM